MMSHLKKSKLTLNTDVYEGYVDGGEWILWPIISAQYISLATTVSNKNNIDKTFY